MKKIYLVIFFVFQLVHVFAQTAIDTTLSLNILQAPISPAFNLMGVSPTSIDRPTDLNSFRVSVQNSSKNFTQLPSSYAVEFSPIALFSKNPQTMEELRSTNTRDVLSQTFSVSVGFTKTDINDTETDSASTPKVGIGLKVSIIRPKFSDGTEKELSKIYDLQGKLNKLKAELLFNDDEVKSIEKSIEDIVHSTDSDEVKVKKITPLNLELSQLKAKILTKESSIEKLEGRKKELSKQVSDLKIVRQGLFLDVAGGTVLEFPTQKFDYSQISKIGAWLTFGFEENPVAFSGILRYLYQPDKIFADDSKKIDSKNISTLDFGIRADYKSKNSKFVVGAEFLYRSVLIKNTVPSSNRFVLNTSYDVGKNQVLTFTFGKNFDGSVEKGGNLIAALNLILGFGSEKKL